MEATIALAAIAHGWRFEPADDAPLDLAPAMTLRPRGRIRLKMHRR